MEESGKNRKKMKNQIMMLHYIFFSFYITKKEMLMCVCVCGSGSDNGDGRELI